ncbi:MAG: flagellar biosynthesis protein FlhB [Spirochaetales bacterium]|nr:flagellar biosynthesis protein FlhB [Spirochaetales bacterium]
MNVWLYKKYILGSLQSPFRSIHLQWFAAEEEGRTEEPTEHKIRKAREEGRVAKSQDLNSAVILIIGTGAVGVLASYVLERILEMMKFFFDKIVDPSIEINGGLFEAGVSFFIRMAFPILAVAFIIAIIINLIQVGFLFTVKPITPDFTKIAPRFGKFFKRALFSQEAGFNFLKTMLKVVIIGVLGFLNVQAEFNKIINLLHVHFFQAFTFIAALAFRIILEAGVVMLALAIIDYVFQRYQHRQQLKMSKQELKEERKMYEGDPLVKSRLRERMREIMNRNMLQAVPKADVVITNPTHFAIALEWDRISMAAPMVSAKGADMIAQKIRELAAEHDIPVIENKPLARALYDEVDIGQVIPEKFYEVLATILAEIYKMRQQGFRQSGSREAI